MMKGYYAVACLVLAALACMESAVSGGAGAVDPASPTVAVLQAATPPAIDEMIVESAGLPIFEPAVFDMRTVCAIEFLNVRGGPGTSWSVLYQLAAGERVRAREWSQGWAMIKAAEWVKGEFLCR